MSSSGSCLPPAAPHFPHRNHPSFQKLTYRLYGDLPKSKPCTVDAPYQETADLQGFLLQKLRARITPRSFCLLIQIGKIDDFCTVFVDDDLAALIVVQDVNLATGIVF